MLADHSLVFFGNSPSRAGKFRTLSATFTISRQRFSVLSGKVSVRRGNQLYFHGQVSSRWKKVGGWATLHGVGGVQRCDDWICGFELQRDGGRHLPMAGLKSRTTLFERNDLLLSESEKTPIS